MTPAEPAALNIMYGRLSSLKKSREVANMSDAQAEVALHDYIEAMCELPADLVEIARKRCMSSFEYTPMPVEILRMVDSEIAERKMASWIIKALLLKAGFPNP